jgi:hypothetical protein
VSGFVTMNLYGGVHKIGSRGKHEEPPSSMGMHRIYSISASSKQLFSNQSIVYCPLPQPLSFVFVFWKASCFEVNHKRSTPVRIHHHDVRGVRLIIGRCGSAINGLNGLVRLGYCFVDGRLMELLHEDPWRYHSLTRAKLSQLVCHLILSTEDVVDSSLLKLFSNL